PGRSGCMVWLNSVATRLYRSVVFPANGIVCLVARGRYWPISLAPVGPSPGRRTANLRMLFGVCAKAKARVPPKGRASATPVPAKAVIFRNFLLLVIHSSKASFPPVRTEANRASQSAERQTDSLCGKTRIEFPHRIIQSSETRTHARRRTLQFG